MFAVKLSKTNKCWETTNCFIKEIDTHWFEIGNYPNYLFADEDIEKVKADLMDKFIYCAMFLFEDGREVIWNRFEKPKKFNGLSIHITI